VLGMGALAEAVLRADGAGVAVAMLAGVCATVPLAFARTRALAAATAITAGTLLTAAIYGAPSAAGTVALVAVWSLLAARRIRAARARAAERDASQRAIEATLLEHTARGERARIARELHDVVAHHISMISVQAETARLATPGMPDDGARQLLAIGETARAALTEMRRLLGVLREDAGDEPTRRPQPGLPQLVELVDAAGASTRLIVRGPVAALDPGVELAAYRIVQEALTNARRHAPGSAVDVQLDYAADVLRVRVRDNGPGPPPGGLNGGHGLLGMRERVATVGGELRFGPAPPTGFLVDATLPLGAGG
jgi:signal transduction histidine kinase